jgi:hypothetical protein
MFAFDEANDVVKRFIAADAKNWEQARQYTYVAHADFFTIEKGQPRKDRSETHDVIFVEGGTFNKLIARNDRPLDPKEQAKEDKKFKQVAEERRKQRHSGVFHRNVSMGTYDDLLTLFDNSLLPAEEIRGHKAWVILCTPKAGHVPANAHEKEVLSFERKFWIDQASDQILRELSTVVGQHITLGPGSTVTLEHEKIADDVWLAVSGIIDGHLQFAKFIKPAVRTDYHHTNFQKFDVQSTITINPAK